jgi:hypothetical protein
MHQRIVPQTVLTIPLSRTALVTIEIGFFVGSGDENLAQSGIAHAMEHLVFKSRRIGEWDASHWDNEAALLGGLIEARTSRDSTVFSLTVPKENAIQAAELLKKMLTRPASSLFTASDWEKEQRVITSEEAMGASDAEKISRALFYQHFYAPTAYAEPIWGSAKTRVNITVPDLFAFYEKYYRPENRWVVIAGGFTPTQAAKIRALFPEGNAPLTVSRISSAPPPTPKSGKTMRILGTLAGLSLRGSVTPPLTSETISWKTHGAMLLLARYQQATFLPGRQGGLFILDANITPAPPPPATITSTILAQLQNEAVSALASETGDATGDTMTEQVARCYSLYAGMGATGFLEKKHYEKYLRQVTLDDLQKADQDIHSCVCVLKGDKEAT